jgi:hypothetical protein
MIPKLFAFVGCPIIEADQAMGDIPDGRHVIFKFTTAHAKDVGLPNYSHEYALNEFRETLSDDMKVIISVTAIDETNAGSIAAAQDVKEWLEFHGADDLDAAGIVVADIGDIASRDSINEDERRNGFDVTLRVSRTVTKTADYIESVGGLKGEFNT